MFLPDFLVAEEKFLHFSSLFFHWREITREIHHGLRRRRHGGLGASPGCPNLFHAPDEQLNGAAHCCMFCIQLHVPSCRYHAWNTSTKCRLTALQQKESKPSHWLKHDELIVPTKLAGPRLPFASQHHRLTTSASRVRHPFDIAKFPAMEPSPRVYAQVLRLPQ